MDTYKEIVAVVIVFGAIAAAVVCIELWRVHQFMTITHWGFWKSFFVLGS